MNWIKRLWQALKPDPYSQIAGLMQFEGYTDFEIDQYIWQLKKENEDYEQEQQKKDSK